MSMITLSREAVAKTGAIPKPPSAESALSGLIKYIPTESVTLYVGAVSAQTALNEFVPWLTQNCIYWIFVALTPVIQLILYFGQLATSGQNWKVPPKSWPWWHIVASTIAFLIWALAVPGNGIIPSGSATGGVVAAFAAVLVSTILDLCGRLFEKKPASEKKPAPSR